MAIAASAPVLPNQRKKCCKIARFTDAPCTIKNQCIVRTTYLRDGKQAGTTLVQQCGQAEFLSCLASRKLSLVNCILCGHNNILTTKHFWLRSKRNDTVYNPRSIYRVTQEECARLRENVPCVKVHRYNPKHLYPKLNGYGDNGRRSLKLRQLLHTY